MPPIVIVIHPLAIRNISQLINTQKQLSIGQFISEPAVERLNITILPDLFTINGPSYFSRPAKTVLPRLYSAMLLVKKYVGLSRKTVI